MDRNLKDLLGIVNALEGRGIQFVSLPEDMDARTTMGDWCSRLLGYCPNMNAV